MAKNDDPKPAGKKKSAATNEKDAASKKKDAASATTKKRRSRNPTSRDAEPETYTLEERIALGMLVEKSKKPLAYLVDTSATANAEGVWLCWPDGCVALNDIGGTAGFIVLIEKNKAFP